MQKNDERLDPLQNIPSTLKKDRADSPVRKDVLDVDQHPLYTDSIFAHHIRQEIDDACVKKENAPDSRSTTSEPSEKGSTTKRKNMPDTTHITEKD